MKRSLLRRGKPLRRKTRFRQRRPTPRRSSRVRDRVYLLWVRSRPCISCGTHHTEAHHAGIRGLGQKSDDTSAIPLCRSCHRCWHDASGPFRNMDHDARRRFAAGAIEVTRAAYLLIMQLEPAG